MGSEGAGVVTVEMVPVKSEDSRLEVILREGMTLEDLIDSLKLPPEKEVVIVNGMYVKPDYPLKDGDVVSIFPFLTGG